MAGEMDALFAEIGGAKAFNKGDSFRDGQGIVLIKELICKPMNDGPTFVAALQVVEATSKGDRQPLGKLPDGTRQYGDLVVPNVAGSAVSWVQKLTKFKSAPGNVKLFILTALGFDESQVTRDQFADSMRRAISKEQPMRGMLLRFSTYQQETRTGARAGQVNTYANFTHINAAGGNSKEDIAKRRAELDKVSPLV